MKFFNTFSNSNNLQLLHIKDGHKCEVAISFKNKFNFKHQFILKMVKEIRLPNLFGSKILSLNNCIY